MCRQAGQAGRRTHAVHVSLVALLLLASAALLQQQQQ